MSHYFLESNGLKWLFGFEDVNFVHFFQMLVEYQACHHQLQMASRHVFESFDGPFESKEIHQLRLVIKQRRPKNSAIKSIWPEKSLQFFLLCVPSGLSVDVNVSSKGRMGTAKNGKWAK